MSKQNTANPAAAQPGGLGDQAARSAIVSDFTRSFFVEAGAGSGKTASLVRRLVNLILCEGVPVSSIAAITFTEAAATELRERLRSALTEIDRTGSYGYPGGEKVNYPNCHDRCREALASLPGAAIGTLHSFAMRILRMFPLEAGLPPEISAAADDAFAVASAEVAAACAAILSRLMEAPDDVEPEISEVFGEAVCPRELAESLEYLTQLGMKGSAPEKCLEWMDQNWGELQPTIDAPLPEPGGLNREKLQESRESLLEIARRCPNETDKLRLEITKAADAFLDIETRGPVAHGFAAGCYEISGFIKIKKNCGTAANWPGGGKDQAIADVEQVVAELTKCADQPRHRAAALVRRAMALLVYWKAQQRVRTGVLEYHDMIFLADRLVADSGVVKALAQQFPYVFVDEFQDTDPVQYRLVTAITRQGNLFTVGDPKQSIYRFRRADVNSYVEAREQAGEENLQRLNTNFRTAASVLDPLNSLFSKLFSGGNIEFTELIPAKTSEHSAAFFITHPTDPDADPADGVLVEEKSSGGRGKSKTNAEELEYDDILAAIREAESGNWRTFGDRPIELSDIAILCPTNKIAYEVIERLQEKNIPVTAEGTLQLFAAPEIVDFLTVVRAVSDPADGFAQVAALRSAWLGCSDVELVREQAGEEDVPAVARARELLSQWRKEAQHLSIGDLVTKMLADLRGQLNMAAWGRPEALVRLRAFTEACHQYAASAGNDLRRFVTWAEHNADESNREAIPVPVLDTANDGVRIMTIHGSKGREFPVVILAGMSSQPASSSGKAIYDPSSGLVEVSFGNSDNSSTVCTSHFQDAAEYEKAESAAELIRLYYVAMTRAENYLVVPLALSRTSKGAISKKQRGAQIMEALLELEAERAAGGDRGSALGDAAGTPSGGRFLLTRSEAFPIGSTKLDEVSPAQPGLATQKTGEQLAAMRQRFADATVGVKAANRRLAHVAVTGLVHDDPELAAPPSAFGAADVLATLSASSAVGEVGVAAEPAAVTGAGDADVVPKTQPVTGGGVQRVREALLPEGWWEGHSVEPLRRRPATAKGQGSMFGTVVHDVMSRLDVGEDAVAAACAEAVARWGLDEALLPEVEAAVRSLAASEVFQRLGNEAEVKRFWREVPIVGSVSVDDGAVVVEGAIDLMYETAEGQLVLADYKTDYRVSEQRMREYFGQLKIYAQLLDRPVARLELVFAREGAAEVRELA